MTPTSRIEVAAGNTTGGMLWMRGMARCLDSQARSRVRTLVEDAKTFQISLKGLLGSKATSLSIANGSDLDWSLLLLSRSSSVHEKVSTCCAKLGFLIKADRKASCCFCIVGELLLHCRLSDGLFRVLGGHWYPFAQILRHDCEYRDQRFGR